jgi:hypothetical protein
MLASKIGLLGGSRTLVITSNQTNFNLHTALGSPSTPVRATVVINSGVVVSSDNASTPAFDQGSLPAGSSVTLINNGSVYGMGGAGGAGGDAFASPFFPYNLTAGNGADGLSGGNALRLSAPTVIVNSAGEIFGGGGGGGGSAGVSLIIVDDGTYAQALSGGGGGGGRSAATSGGGAAGVPSTDFFIPSLVIDSGDAGASGGSSGEGTGGAGGSSEPEYSYSAPAAGNGGDWGEAGASGSAPSTPTEADPYILGTSGSGGAAGKAVDLNGQSITWVSGNTVDRVKGAVS